MVQGIYNILRILESYFDLELLHDLCEHARVYSFLLELGEDFVGFVQFWVILFLKDYFAHHYDEFCEVYLSWVVLVMLVYQSRYLPFIQRNIKTMHQTLQLLHINRPTTIPIKQVESLSKVPELVLGYLIHQLCLLQICHIQL